jgi:methylated-DNA-protein-cysteine methyltransferase-like protein
MILITYLKYYFIIASMKGFYEQVYNLVAKIPAGRVTTYGDIAKMLGHPRAARFVGYAMNASCETDSLPWHRVTFADGKTWDGQWEKVQRDLLTSEGVGFTQDGRIDVEKYRWHPESLDEQIALRDMPLKF